MTLSIENSATYVETSPQLSVLIPFYKDDARALLKDLDSQLSDGQIEVLFYDDGTNDTGLTANMRDAVATAKGPIRLITNENNQGRSAARNALFDAARGDWVLFLDADMRPARNVFLGNYISLIESCGADILFGGFEVEAQQADADRDIHRALSEISDCLTLDERQAAGPQYVASSNLCVRRKVLEEEPFDSGFTGWGWEDSEWAARVSKRFTLVHVDNPAIHLGLETTETLLKRFATSGANYLRFTTAHPELAERLPLYNISKTLGRLPGQSLMRPFLRLFVKTHILPMRARLTALKLWRASHYAEALS
ncbi:MAG: glycosyltransferase family 2 protein [Litorimonas sp.]